jgi:hypothetical protein
MKLKQKRQANIKVKSIISALPAAKQHLIRIRINIPKQNPADVAAVVGAKKL